MLVTCDTLYSFSDYFNDTAFCCPIGEIHVYSVTNTVNYQRFSRLGVAT